MKATPGLRNTWWKRATGGWIVLVLGCGGMVTASAVDSNDAAPSMVNWAVPPLRANTPQTPEQDAYNKQHGRPLPPPEPPQPTLDPALTDFQPSYHKNELRGDYKCGASDVLAELSKT